MVSSDAIVAMKAIASDPKKRPVLMQDAACIGGLVMVLSNPDVNIVRLSLQTLSLLAESAQNLPQLRDFLGLLDQLEMIVLKPTKEKDVHSLAMNLFTTLSDVEMVTPLKDSKNYSRRNSSMDSSKSFIGKRHGKAKNTILQLRGMMDKSDRELVMRLLLKIRGVISITFDLINMRCVVRSRPDVKPEYLAQSVSRSMTMTAQQVVKDDTGHEVLLSFGSNLQEVDKENEEHMPDYLSDDCDSPSPVASAKVISRVDGKNSRKASGWLSSAASFISNSFYW